jgi:hypothetical protein
MAPLPSRGTLTRTFFALLVVAVPFAGSGGCNSRSACLQYSPGEYAANGNACLSPSQALGSFTDPSCPGPITSVDGDGSFDGQLCCYPVTYADITPDCGQGGAGGTINGFGGAGGTINGFGGAGGAFMSETSGVGSTGFSASAEVSSSGGGVCVSTCAATLTNGGMACTPSSEASYDALIECACALPDGGAGCFALCGGFCNAFGPIPPACASCLTIICPAQLSTCQNN